MQALSQPRLGLGLGALTELLADVPQKLVKVTVHVLEQIHQQPPVGCGSWPGFGRGFHLECGEVRTNCFVCGLTLCHCVSSRDFTNRSKGSESAVLE